MTYFADMPRFLNRSLNEYSFFLDIDGTLAELQQTPDEVSIPKVTIDQLNKLFDLSAGAVALISGRPLAQIDKLVSPLQLPAAGVHGAEIRLASGAIEMVEIPVSRLAQLENALLEAISPLRGVVLETKPFAFALHYRQALSQQSALKLRCDQIITEFPEFMVQPGKRVYEIKPVSRDKGLALERFMQTPPFKNKYPVMIGDDLTDEAAFAQVNSLAGVSIKVGVETSLARYRLNDVSAVYHWLCSLVQHSNRQLERNSNE